MSINRAATIIVIITAATIAPIESPGPSSFVDSGVDDWDGVV